jgi:large subunit ribosomal protein L32
MAVPKKKMSKSRRNSRRATWKKKVLKQVQLALTIGNSIFNSNLVVF